MVSPFENLGLLPQFVQVVETLGFEQPTPIQQAAIPALLEGRNVIGQAQTGTGKTAAYALPMLQQIQPGKGAIQALILAPTRELAIQVAEASTRMAQHTSARILAVYGGQPYYLQTRQIKLGVDVVVGTPGRLLDLLRQKVLDLSQVRYLVLDEADEMLEMGFIEDVETIMAQIPAERQMSLFSATLPNAVCKLADRYITAPHKITINPKRPTVAETEQRYYRVHPKHKLDALTRLLEAEDVNSALIFARTKAGAQLLADELNQRGYTAESLHGDLNQAKREFVLNRFRQQAISLMVATDVAARGLDIENVSHVFNYDAPEQAEEYVHRIGRTGRAGRKGIAITLVSPHERNRLNQIEAYTHQAISECQVPSRDAILARRDERFLQRLVSQLGKSDISRERALIAQLAETQTDLMDIAAAAIQLARASESEISAQDIIAPSADRTGSRAIRLKTGNKKLSDIEKKIPLYKEREWQSYPSRKPSTPHSRRDKPQQEPGMIRLQMNLGKAHGILPRDVVGAIASEVGIPGRAIGAIDIQKEHTFIDVAEKHVRRVLKASDGKYQLRGKSVMLKLAS